MPKRFNFKRDISRPFMRGVVHPLVDVARPFVNQGLAALKDKGIALAKDYGTQALQTLAEQPYQFLKLEVGLKAEKAKASLL